MTSRGDIEMDENPGSGNDIPPWLQAVPEDADDGSFVTGNKMLFAAIGGAFVIVALFVAAIMYFYSGTSSAPAIHVEAPKTAIKEKPIDPGGMSVEHRDKAIFDQSDGVKPRGQASLGEQPEIPVAEIADDPVGDVIEEVTETRAAVDTEVIAPAASAVAPAPETSETSDFEAEVSEAVPTEIAPATAKQFRVQLGAYGNEASASRAWRNVRSRFIEILRDQVPSYEAVQSGDRTLYRLRVGPYADRVSADQACLALRAKDQACIVVNP